MQFTFIIYIFNIYIHRPTKRDPCCPTVMLRLGKNIEKEVFAVWNFIFAMNIRPRYVFKSYSRSLYCYFITLYSRKTCYKFEFREHLHITYTYILSLDLLLLLFRNILCSLFILGNTLWVSKYLIFGTPLTKYEKTGVSVANFRL
jgi:hypothetical protein